jgi:hypothetical protein
MKTIRLPIYEDGVETNEYLEIDITFFISSHRGLRNTQVKVMPEPLADWERELLECGGVEAMEKEAIDRIISGLPPSPGDKARARHSAIMEKLETERAEHSEIFDEADIYNEPQHEWRPIKGFESYDMNRNRMIIDRGTHRSIEQKTNGRARRVMLFDAQVGRMKTISVEFLFAQTFPELNK